jgi:NADP-dependent 3-hydroxy acid dehydrogenase YdfG
MARYHLNDKVLLITGAGGGIGSASARKLVAKGAKVVLVDLSSNAVGALAAQ